MHTTQTTHYGVEERINIKQQIREQYIRSIDHLQGQKAKSGLYVDISIINHIKHCEDEIRLIDNEINMLMESKYNNYSIQFLENPMEKYDNFLVKFFDESKRYTEGDFMMYIINRLRVATKSELFAFVRNNEYKKIIAFDGNNYEIMQRINGNENDVINKFINETKKYNNMINYDDNRNRIMIKHTDNGCIIFVNQDIIGIDDCFDIIFNEILDKTNNLSRNCDFNEIEMKIYNKIKEKYKYVSNYMYNRQFRIFKEFLMNMDVYFEPIIFLSKHPYIYGWEALARDPLTKKAPINLFNTADLWGIQFQLELDMYFLEKSIMKYGISVNNKVIAKSTKIFINVYPESLVRTKYLEMVEALDNNENVPLNSVYLEISEKFDIPTVDKEYKGARITNFFDLLKIFTKNQVHFAIDDFGVGYASSSRLSRLRPAVVKIDRDALIDKFGDQTIKYVVDLVQSKGGEMKIIMEGFDKHSNFTLKTLYELGIRYIQGHSFGMAQEEIQENIVPNVVESIRRELFR